MAELFEFAMLFTFGFSWPFSIAKTYRAKRVDGKSPLFMFIILLGYTCGIVARLVDGKPENDWLVFVYLLDMALVSTDLSLYFHYLRKNRLMKLFVATHNAHKIREISQILPDLDIEADDPADVEENAPDFGGNALLKVRAIAARHAGAWCLADDSGLEVEALGGAPGVRSARYAGEPANTPANNALLLKNLSGVTNRRANFTCAVALVAPDGTEQVVVGRCYGRIAESPSGAAGFGYDPLFIPDGHDKSFAELTADEKNAISHRGRALAQVRAVLTGGGGSNR